MWMISTQSCQYIYQIDYNYLCNGTINCQTKSAFLLQDVDVNNYCLHHFVWTRQAKINFKYVLFYIKIIYMARLCNTAYHQSGWPSCLRRQLAMQKVAGSNPTRDIYFHFYFFTLASRSSQIGEAHWIKSSMIFIQSNMCIEIQLMQC